MPRGRAVSASLPAADSAPSAFLSSEADDLQSEFKVIQDSYSRTRLPNDLHFVGRQKGLKAEAREVASIISNSAKSIEVTLKILADIEKQTKLNSSFRVNEALDEVLTCQIAQLRYLQEEQAALFVQGQFGKKTHTLFRQFKRHTATLHTSDLDVLRAAAQLAAVPPEPQAPASGFRGRGRGGFGFRGQGGFGGRGRGAFQPPGFNSAFPRSAPADRVDEQS